MKKFLAGVLISLSGCGTILGSEDRGIAPFRGIETDIRWIARDRHPVHRILIFDIPLSLSLDLVLLPVTFTLCLVEDIADK